MIVDWQYEPIKGKLLHIDLKRIALDKVLKVSVPIILVGESAGVEAGGRHHGTDACARSRSSACRGIFPATSMPTSSQLTFGKVLRVSELPHSEKIKFITDANQPVAHVTSVKEEVVATPDAAAAEAAAPAEPEVYQEGQAGNR